jgi:DNA polymerase III subunit delta'
MTKFNWPIVGHSSIINYLQTVIKNDRLNHAYLFYGPDNLGKTELAKNFIISIYCEDSNRPCHKCNHCLQIEKNIHPDIINISRESDKKNITIEQIREARNKIYHASFLNSHKIVLIKESNTLSLAASNALLKILEEPTKKTIFIFIAPSLKNIPQTILSRVQAIKFLPVSITNIEKYLVKKGIEKEQAYELGHLAGGYPGKVLHFLNHPKLLSDYKKDNRELLATITGDLNMRFKLIESLAGQVKSANAKDKSRLFLSSVNSLFRDILLIRNMCFDKVTHTYLKIELSKASSEYSSEKLAKILHKIKFTRAYIDQNVNLRLALENLMLEI